MKSNLTRVIVIFAVLTIVGICLIVFGQAATQDAVRTVLPLIGTAMFASALTYILVKLG